MKSFLKSAVIRNAIATFSVGLLMVSIAQAADVSAAGMTDAQAEKEIVARENARNQTGFVRVHGRRPR